MQIEAPALTTDCPPPGTAAWQQAVEQLHATLRQSDYSECQWIPTRKRLIAAPLEPMNLWHFGSRGRRRLMEPTAVPGLYRRLQTIRKPRVERLLAFFGLGEAWTEADLQLLLNQMHDAPTLDVLQGEQIVQSRPDGRLHSRLRFIPHGKLLLVSDRDDRSIANFTYIGRDSLMLADLLKQSLAGRAVQRGLDICCGCGIQALTVAGFTQLVMGVDLNPRGVAFSRLNAALNGCQSKVQFVQGDLADDINGPFDLVVANPPFVFMPPEMAANNRDGFGGDWGLEFVGRIVADLDRLLGPDGEAYLLSASPVVEGQSMLEEVIERGIKSANLGAHLVALHYRVDAELHRFQREHGMRYEIAYLVQIGRKMPREVCVSGLSPLARMANRAYVELANLLCR